MATEKAASTSEIGQLKTKTVLSYSVFAIPIAALGLPLVVYLPPYYASEVGMSLTAIGAAFGLARIFDIVIDPIVGAFQDKTRSRFGRRKVWIAAAIPLLMVSVWFLFNPPKGAGLFYLYASLLTMYFAYLMAVVSHLSWGAELSAHYHGRTRLQGWREACIVAGYLVVLAIPAAITGLKLGTEADGVRIMGLYTVILFPVLGLITLTQVPDEAPPEAKPVHWNDAFLAFGKNKPFQLVIIAEFFSGFAPGVTGALFLFFFNSYLDLGGLSTVLLLIYFISGLLGVPVWLWLSYRIGKHRALVASMIYQSVAFVMIGLLPKGDFTVAAIGMLVAGISSNAASFLLRAMMADVVDEDRLITGEQRTGLFYGIMLTAAKIGLALAPLITYPILQHYGFVAALGPKNTEGALDALLWLFIAAPIAGNLLLCLFVWNFPIDAKRLAEIRTQLAAQST